MLEDFFLLMIATAGSLLPITHPFSTAPVFLAITRPLPAARRNQQARMAAIYMAAVLLVALAAGAVILAFFGISLYALRIAGGIVIARVGLSMLQPGRDAGTFEVRSRPFKK